MTHKVRHKEQDVVCLQLYVVHEGVLAGGSGGRGLPSGGRAPSRDTGVAVSLGLSAGDTIGAGGP